MESQFVLAGALLVILGSCSDLPAQLDLTPEPGVYYGEGTPFPCVRFHDGEKVVRFTPPANWRFTAEGKKCVFHAPGVTQASGSFEVVPLDEKSELKPEERLQSLLIAKLPAEAADVVWTLKDLPGVKLDRWPAQHVQATYNAFGQKIRVALLLVPMEREILQVRFGCRAADFDRVFMPLLESMGTFTWNPTDEDRPPVAKSNEAGAATKAGK